MELTTLFKNIADAIREKDGTTPPINAENFPERIRSLKTVPEYAIFSPRMTSYNTPAPYVVNVSGILGDQYNCYGWHAFDGVNSQEWWSAKSTNPGPWISFDFGKKTEVGGIGLYPRTNYANQLPSTFSIQGSDDGSNWTNILSFLNLPTPPQGEYRKHIFNNVVNYRFYRLYDIISNYAPGTGNCSIEDIVFYIPI